MRDQETNLAITKEWLIPFLPVPEDQWRSDLFLKAWQRFALEEGDYAVGGYFCTRIEIILDLIPGPHSMRSTQVITSLIAWFGRNVGFCFLTGVLKSLTNEKAPLFLGANNLEKVLMAWAKENKLHDDIVRGGRILYAILGLKPNDKTLTLSDLDAAEALMYFVATKDGRNFFGNLVKQSHRKEHEMFNRRDREQK